MQTWYLETWIWQFLWERKKYVIYLTLVLSQVLVVGTNSLIYTLVSLELPCWPFLDLSWYRKSADSLSSEVTWPWITSFSWVCQTQYLRSALTRVFRNGAYRTLVNDSVGQPGKKKLTCKMGWKRCKFVSKNLQDFEQRWWSKYGSSKWKNDF